MSDNQTKQDYAGGSYDDVADALDSLRRSGWPFMLVLTHTPDQVDVFANQTPKSASSLADLLSHNTFLDHLKWAVYEATRPDSGP